ncbi:MAG: DEAD/DEAH box helicase, partial [Bdellovibrionota bacterium]
HIIAIFLWLRSERGPTASPVSTNFRVIEYHLLDHPENGLILERWLASQNGVPPEKLTTTLVSRLSAESHGNAPEGGRTSATQADVQVDAVLGPQPGAWTSLRAIPVMKLFQALADSNRITLNKNPVRVSPRAIRPHAELLDHGHNAFLFRPLPSESVARSWPAAGVALGSDQILRPIDTGAIATADLALFKDSHGTVLGDATLVPFLTNALPQLLDYKMVTVRTERLPTVEILPTRMALEIHPSDQASHFFTTVRLVYGDPPIAVVRGDGALARTPLGEKTRKLPMRSRFDETRLADSLWKSVQLRPNETQALSTSALARVGSWFESVAPQEKIVTERSQALDRLASAPELKFALEESTSDGLPSISAGFRINNSDPLIPFEDVWKNWNPLEPWIVQPAGGYAKLPADWLTRYGADFSQLLQRNSPDARRGTAWKLELDHLCTSASVDRLPALIRLRERLERPDSIDYSIDSPSFLTDVVLRPYQAFGIRWLQARQSLGLGCILADDMGLGKTLQALAVTQGPALVICPASVLSVWQDQIARFRPDLKVHTYHGPARALAPSLSEKTIVLTSYATARIDQAILGRIHWRTLIADEAQTIRNRETQNTQAVMSLCRDDASDSAPQFRIAMTGTPIENRVEDLWTLLEFANQGTRVIQPFVLRRKKAEVAADLPSRTEALIRVTPAESERTTYDHLHLALRSDVARLVGGPNTVPISILEVLLRLRQACCDSALLPGAPAGLPPSSKTQVLIHKIRELVEEGHRCLVFSQWTRYLDRITLALDEAGITHLRIDGTTQNRGALVAQFQDQSPGHTAPPVFLLSLKAGGVGLTLTAADHVFILDPWWNPAVEDQAADR